MQKNKILAILVTIPCILTISWLLYQPKSIATALKRIHAPFEVGEVITTKMIDENTTVTLYINKENPSQLQNVIIHKNGPFYVAHDLNGSLEIAKPAKLERGALRSQLLISWYDKPDKYVVMAINYDDEVRTITYGGQTLIPTPYKGYQIFYGFGNGENLEYCLYDKNGNQLEHIKP